MGRTYISKKIDTDGKEENKRRMVKRQEERTRGKNGLINELPATKEKPHISKYLLSLTTLSNCIYPFRVSGVYKTLASFHELHFGTIATDFHYLGAWR